jgi:hypothetical protein
MERYTVAALLLAGVLFGGLACAAESAPQDYVIKEGSGLTKLFLGMTSDQAVRNLGEADQDLYGFVFVHNLPDGTALSYRIEDDHVVAINLKGDAKSKYLTQRGARLGMLRNSVILLYGTPEAVALNKIFYHSLGVGFFFNNDVLYDISIVPPGKVAPLRR